MKKLLLIFALMVVAGFSSQAMAGVHFSVGVGGGGYYDPYYGSGCYSYPGYYGYYRPYSYYGPTVYYYRRPHYRHHYYRY